MFPQVKNSKGKVWYGLHFYPGVAQYQEEESEPYRVFLNEDTLRKMDPTFAGRPIFVEHVDEVNPDINQLRKEAEGWVVESFFNSADGCHWVKFMTVTDAAEKVIKNGYRLSNAYIPKSFKQGGLWNGVPYQKEITEAEYEHLAIVKHPRYEESIILDPEEFKKYNEDKFLEIKKVANSKERPKMNFSFFKRTKVENAIDPELQVILPSSGKSISLLKLINDADIKSQSKKNEHEKEQDPAIEKPVKDAADDDGKHSMANVDHMVKMHDGSYMKIKDMMNKYKQMSDDMDDIKKPKKDSEEKELDLEVKPEGVDAEGDLHNVEPDSEDHKMEMKDELLESPESVVHDDDDEDKKAKKKALQLAEHEDKEIESAKKEDAQKNKKKNDLIKAERLKNAHLKANQSNVPSQTIELSWDLAKRGKERYGS